MPCSWQGTGTPTERHPAGSVITPDCRCDRRQFSHVPVGTTNPALAPHLTASFAGVGVRRRSRYHLSRQMSSDQGTPGGQVGISQRPGCGLSDQKTRHRASTVLVCRSTTAGQCTVQIDQERNAKQTRQPGLGSTVTPPPLPRSTSGLDPTPAAADEKTHPERSAFP